MDIQDIAAAVRREYTLDLHGLHGAWHWLRVRQNGLWLAERTPDADVEVTAGVGHELRRRLEHVG